MKRKITAILLVVALALSLGLIPAVPAAASQVTETYTSDVGDMVRMLEVSDPASGPTDFTALEAAGGWTSWHSAVATSHGSWANISGVEWIQSNATTNYPGGDWWYEFKKEIPIPPLAGNISGSIQVNADNANEVHLNGDTYCVSNPPNDTQDGEIYGTWSDDHEWGNINTWDVSSSLQTGTNDLLIVIRNYPIGSFNPHGVTYKLTVSYELPDIEKTMVSDGYLGDIITVTLDVENPYGYDLTVQDVIPDGLKYILGTFMVDSGSGPVAVIPTIVGNTISTTVGNGDHTITFDVQVVEVQCEDVTVTNEAKLLDNGDEVASDSADITLWPYEGFTKEIEWGQKWHGGEWYDLPDPTVVPIGTDIKWLVVIGISNVPGDDVITMQGVVVQDRLGGDLELLRNAPSTGVVSTKESGKTKKVHLTWKMRPLVDGQSEQLQLVISTDMNPGNNKNFLEGHQEYTSPGDHELNSGAVVKFIDIEGTGFQLSAHTCPLSVYVPDGMLLLENKDSDTWQIKDDDRWGDLYYSTEGDEFSFVFQGYGLDDIEYSLIYYADFVEKFTQWGGNNPGALIATGTASSGDLVMSDSINLGMNLPSPPDANISIHDYSGFPDYYAHAHGAKIWLVPSSMYDATNPAPQYKVTVWSPDDFLFETDLIWYTDTDAP